MSAFKTILRYAGFGKKQKMANNSEFEPTHIFKHRYQDPKVLVDYVKTLPDKFKDEDIKVKLLDRGRLALGLPRKLNQEEIEGALQHFEKIANDKSQDQD